MPRRGGSPGARVRAAAWFAAPFLGLLALWVLIVEITAVPSRVFPGPSDVWAEAVEMAGDGSLVKHLSASLRRVLIGVSIALVTAIPFGMAMGANRYVAGFFTPILRFSVALAGIAWIPLATLWFGFTDGAVIFIIFNSVFFALVYNTMLGVSRIPVEQLRVARSLGARRLSMVFEVLLPGALPSIVTGLRVGMGYGWRGLIAAEIIATGAGLGYVLFLSQKFFQTDVIVLSMVIIGLLWLLMDRLILAPLERRTVQRWGMIRRVGP